MTNQEKAMLVKQAKELCKLGLAVERHRERLRRLVDEKVPYNSPQMWNALLEFQAADDEWKRLEQEHLRYKAQLGMESNILR